jgi:hypothetical protein
MDAELLQALHNAGWPAGSVPTLSELVDACVRISAQQDFHLEHLEGEDWRAASCHLGETTWSDHDGWCDGATPEEAVARLWLALNALLE